MVLTGNPILLLLAFFLTGINRGAISILTMELSMRLLQVKHGLNLLHSLLLL